MCSTNLLQLSASLLITLFPCAEITCSDVSALENGDIAYNTEDTDVRPINTVATYRCNDGYILSGDTTRTCKSSGMWSGSEAPICEGESALIKSCVILKPIN